ncbi:MAG: hypothetical protein KatS3mg105_2866 [Gemmatales bacterium]|nr:MAG: hypothetical protein KatS3mg105_2866 [Gemmatales bacterium]
MNGSDKIEAMLELMCSEVGNVILNNRAEAAKFAQNLPIRQLFEDFGDTGTGIGLMLNAASMSDVFFFLVHSIQADGQVDQEELFCAMQLVSQSLYRYCWLNSPLF